MGFIGGQLVNVGDNNKMMMASKSVVRGSGSTGLIRIFTLQGKALVKNTVLPRAIITYSSFDTSRRSSELHKTPITQK